MSDITLGTLDVKLDTIDERITTVSEQLAAMNGRQREDHDEITRLKEQMATQNRFQIAMSMILSVIAGVIGTAK